MLSRHLFALRHLDDTVDWEAVARLAGIPEPAAPIFVWWLWSEIEHIRSGAATEARTEADSRSIDADVRKAARALIRVLKRRGRATDATVAGLVSGFLGRDLAERRRGAPHRADAFADFVYRLLTMIHLVGGRATFSRVTGGTVAGILGELRPALPPGFIPAWKHPPTAIERAVTKARALVVGSSGDSVAQLTSEMQDLVGEIEAAWADHTERNPPQ